MLSQAAEAEQAQQEESQKELAAAEEAAAAAEAALRARVAKLEDEVEQMDAEAEKLSTALMSEPSFFRIAGRKRASTICSDLLTSFSTWSTRACC